MVRVGVLVHPPGVMEQGERMHDLGISSNGDLGELQSCPADPGLVGRPVYAIHWQLVAFKDRADEVFHTPG